MFGYLYLESELINQNEQTFAAFFIPLRVYKNLLSDFYYSFDEILGSWIKSTVQGVDPWLKNPPSNIEVSQL